VPLLYIFCFWAIRGLLQLTSYAVQSELPARKSQTGVRLFTLLKRLRGAGPLKLPFIIRTSSSYSSIILLDKNPVQKTLLSTKDRNIETGTSPRPRHTAFSKKFLLSLLLHLLFSNSRLSFCLKSVFNSPPFKLYDLQAKRRRKTTTWDPNYTSCIEPHRRYLMFPNSLPYGG
jgi:hypothetical protein